MSGSIHRASTQRVADYLIEVFFSDQLGHFVVLDQLGETAMVCDVAAFHQNEGVAEMKDFREIVANHQRRHIEFAVDAVEEGKDAGLQPRVER